MRNYGFCTKRHEYAVFQLTAVEVLSHSARLEVRNGRMNSNTMTVQILGLKEGNSNCEKKNFKHFSKSLSFMTSLVQPFCKKKDHAQWIFLSLPTVFIRLPQKMFNMPR